MALDLGLAAAMARASGRVGEFPGAAGRAAQAMLVLGPMSDRQRPRLPGTETDLSGDLAGTYRATHSQAAAQLPASLVERDLTAVSEQGFVVIPQLLTPEEVRQARDGLSPLLGHVGRNDFEGKRTQRVYGMIEKTRAVDRLIDHPRILALLDRLLLPNYLLSQAQAINILAGESAQALHPDDGFYRVPRPRPGLSAATVWALDDFTTDNGATRLIPGSHLWPDGRLPTDDDSLIQAVMPAGSVVFYPGTLWHGGGENRSGQARLAVTCQYCEPWLRTQENYFLSVSKQTARTVTEDIRRMLGYSIYPPFMGMVNGMHPKRTLVPTDDD